MSIDEHGHRFGNLLAGVPLTLPEELVQVLVQDGAVRIERIVSRGHASPPGFWYDQDEDEWVLLLTGSAGVRFAGEAVVLALRPGDHVTIPAHTRHRVEWTDPREPTVWVAVHYRPFTPLPSSAGPP